MLTTRKDMDAKCIRVREKPRTHLAFARILVPTTMIAGAGAGAGACSLLDLLLLHSVCFFLVLLPLILGPFLVHWITVDLDWC